MRIVVIANHRFPERSQTFVLDQLLHLVRQGHEVRVLCEEKGDVSLLDATDAEALKSVVVTEWPGAPGWMKRTRLWRLQALISDFRRRRLLRALRSDLLLAHFGWAGARIAALRGGIQSTPPLVTIYHGRDVGAEWQKNRMADYRRLFRTGALHLPVNEVFAELLMQAGAPADRVRPLHLGVPTEEYIFRPPQRGQVLHFVSACRLVEKKGISTALEALGRLRRDHSDLDWRYDIGGEGPQEPALRKLVAEMGLQGHVSFLGPLKHESTLALLRKADVLLQPSVTAEDGDQEGIPIILMEAMAIGTVVCSTRHSGIPELVEHDVSGLLSDEHDVEGFAENLRRIARAEVDLPAMARAARHRIETAFDAKTQVALLERHCMDVVARSSGAKGTARA